MDYQRDEHRVHLVAYHLVWCPKRRKAVLTGSIAADCEGIIREVCKERRWDVIRVAVMPDHVHLFVRADPSTPASDVVKACKGRSSRVLRERYEILRRLPSLWTRSFFCATAGNVSQAAVDRYIAAQRGK